MVQTFKRILYAGNIYFSNATLNGIMHIGKLFLAKVIGGNGVLQLRGSKGFAYFTIKYYHLSLRHGVNNI